MKNHKPVETVLGSLVGVLMNGNRIQQKALVRKIISSDEKREALKRQYKNAGEETQEFIKNELEFLSEDLSLISENHQV
jgi:hypothetical protein